MTTTVTTTTPEHAVRPRALSSPFHRLRRALHAETIKLTTVRAYGIILLLTVAVAGLANLGVGRYVDDGTMTVANMFVFGLVFAAVLAAVAGILLFSSEVQHGTLAPTLTAQPRRATIVLAKGVVAAGYGTALGLSGAAAGVAGAAVSGIPLGDASAMIATTGWAVLFTTLSAVLGLGVGMVARHGTAAISGLLAWWLLVENLLTAFLDARLARFLPFVAGNGLLAIINDTPAALGAALTRPQNALVFAGYAAAALVAGAVLLRRRDVQ
jgi:ABC-type transport system involved in multi-copper enzyme maturation permease subunit